MQIVSSLPPTIVHSRADIAATLTQCRHDLGLTGEALDHIAGFSDRYTAKLERGEKPYGRKGFVIEPGKVTVSPMAEIWLESLGVSLVLMTTSQAADIGAKPALATVH